MRFMLRSLILAPVVMATAALATNSAMAEPTVNVPFSFAVAGKTAPAGLYSVQRDNNRAFVTLSSKTAPVTFKWILTPGDGVQRDGKVTLRFTQQDQSYTLQSVQYGPQTTHRLDKPTKHSEHQPVRIVEGQ